MKAPTIHQHSFLVVGPSASYQASAAYHFVPKGKRLDIFTT